MDDDTLISQAFKIYYFGIIYKLPASNQVTNSYHKHLRHGFFKDRVGQEYPFPVR
jgi:hypothetical protein